MPGSPVSLEQFRGNGRLKKFCRKKLEEFCNKSKMGWMVDTSLGEVLNLVGEVMFDESAGVSDVLHSGTLEDS